MFAPRQVREARLSHDSSYGGDPRDGESLPSAQACLLPRVGPRQPGCGVLRTQRPRFLSPRIPGVSFSCASVPSRLWIQRIQVPALALALAVLSPSPDAPAPWTWCPCLTMRLEGGLWCWRDWDPGPYCAGVDPDVPPQPERRITGPLLPCKQEHGSILASFPLRPWFSKRGPQASHSNSIITGSSLDRQTPSPSPRPGAGASSVCFNELCLSSVAAGTN